MSARMRLFGIHGPGGESRRCGDQLLAGSWSERLLAADSAGRVGDWFRFGVRNAAR